MSKRFFDTDMVRKKWYRQLPNKMKAAWFYILCSCNGAGIWDIDEELLSFHLKEEITLAEIKKYFGDRTSYIRNDKKLVVNNFVFFQNGELKNTNNAHRSIIKILKDNGLSSETPSPSAAPKEGPREGTKYSNSKSIVKVKVKEEAGAKNLNAEKNYIAEHYNFLSSDVQLWLSRCSIKVLRDLKKRYFDGDLATQIDLAFDWDSDQTPSKKKKKIGSFLKGWMGRSGVDERVETKKLGPADQFLVDAFKKMEQDREKGSARA